MMEFSVCIDSVFYGRDFYEGIKKVKKAGIDAFEFWSFEGKNLNRIKDLKEELGMEVSTFCTKYWNLTDDSKLDIYIEGLRESIEHAQYLNCSRLITQVGNEIAGVSRERQHENIVKGLRACAPILENEGITLLFEPLNTLVDHKGYYLYSSNEAFDIETEVSSPMVKVLFDIYHQQIMEGNLISNISRNIDKIGHFHAAGVPGRHELSTGEIDYNRVFDSISKTGYKGFVGLEYFPINDPWKGLSEEESIWTNFQGR